MKTQHYADFWALALEHHQIASMRSRIDAQDVVIRASQLMLPIELLAPKYVHEAAIQVLRSMMDRDADGEQRGAAMLAFRLAVARELKLT